MAIIDLPRTQAASGSTEQQLKAISDQIRVFRDQVERQLIDLESGTGTVDTAASSAALSQIVSDISDIQSDIETIQSALPGKLEASDLSTIENSINAINTALGNKLNTTGDGKDVTVSATAADIKANLSTGEKLSVSIGKLMKWFTDFATVAWSGSYNDLSDKPPLSSGDFLQEQIDGINTNVGDMALSTVATDLTGAINETHEIVEEVAEKLNDTGWVEVPSAWYATSITAHPTPLKYRKIGNTVHFYGGLKTTVQRNAKTTYNAITLPAALNPVEARFIPQVNGNFDACVAGVESGALKWCNIPILGANGTMLFHLSYLTD